MTGPRQASSRGGARDGRRPGRAPAWGASLALAGALAWSLGPGCGGPPEIERPGAEAPPPPQDVWPGPEPGTKTPTRPQCRILDEQARPGGSFVFALHDSVLPGRAPVPHNPSERIVFAHLYETLVRVDCEGRLLPGLASHWTCTEDSTVWVFTLRKDARFWDGTRITPDVVREAWSANQDCPAGAGGGSPWAWLNPRAQTVTPVDGRRLAIRLPEPQVSFPWLLAHPATAVALRQREGAWPLGSGWAAVDADASTPDLACRPNAHHPQAPIWRELTFRVLPGSDPRDLAAGQVDLLVVRTLNQVEFFRSAPGYDVLPLPWNQLYVLVCPPQGNRDGVGIWLPAVRPADALPRSATVDWRSWDRLEFPAWTAGSCPQLTGPVADRGSAPLQWGLADLDLDGRCLVYPRDDAAGRELAEHVAARTLEPVRTVPLPEEQLAFVLQWQMAGAIILPCRQQYPTGCLQLACLLGRASWLQAAFLSAAAAGDLPQPDESLVGAGRYLDAPGPAAAAALRAQGLAHPLGLTRSWLVSRAGLAGLALDFDGTPLAQDLGRAEPASGPSPPSPADREREP